MSTTHDWLNQLKKNIPEISPQEALALQKQGALFIDVRTPTERQHGTPKDAIAIERDFLEFTIEPIIPDKTQSLIVLCQSGKRSLLAAHSLCCCGYENVSSLTGGFSRWKAENLPIEKPFILSLADRERYSRQLLLPEIGDSGQERLLKSKVLLVGAGGLSSPAALYLAAAGVGTLGIIDGDTVELNNLHRQIIHRESFIHHYKVDSAKSTLQQLNSTIKIITYPDMLSFNNIESIFSQYDIIVDGSDNFATRYLVNDFCVKLNLPNVHGSIFAFDGLVTVFDRSPCYRCMYPTPPAQTQVPSCAEGGVLGVLPGVIGTLQAVEAIKLILQMDNNLVGRLLYYNARTSKFREYQAQVNSRCELCRDPQAWMTSRDYKKLHTTCELR